MVKYRLLTIEELKGLQKEFVEYLVLNGIIADDWLKMKNEDPKKADTVISLFSDLVFEKIMKKAQFLEMRRPKDIRVLQCLKDKFIVMGLNASKIPASAGGHEANLNDFEYVKNAVKNPPSNLEVFTSEIPYKLSREKEVFNMTEEGFNISDGKLFKTLCLALSQ